jgi:hypothetical protein
VKLSKGRLLPPLRLIDLLLRDVGGPEPARPVEELHASDLTHQDREFCPREVVLMRKLGVQHPERYIPHALRVTFDDGRDKQWRVNNNYLRPYMFGPWRCRRCDAVSDWSAQPKGAGCPTGKHDWEYKEPEFRHPSGFTGSIDGIVKFSSAHYRMVEVKIMNVEDYKELVAPLAEHRVRTRLYLRLVAECPEDHTAKIDVSEAHLLYIARGHGLKGDRGQITPFKEYIVKRDDASVERYVRMAYAVSGPMPEGVCSDVMCKRAKVCPVRKPCFSGQYPAENFWSSKS